MNPEQWTRLAEWVNTCRNVNVVDAQAKFGDFNVDFTHDAEGFDLTVTNSAKEAK